MTLFTQLLAAAGIVLTLSSQIIPGTATTSTPPAPATSNATYAPVAVLELFTSQGCSSCPSADRLLTETLGEATKSTKNIIGLSFHVDYWDRLGWKDPFSSNAFTKRQYQYSEHFAQNGVYTPQEVLNGQQEFVGSNRGKLLSALKTALSQPATAGVQLEVSAPKDNKITVRYELSGDLADGVLNIALVSKTTETIVQRGENAGRKLIHDNVVRVFQTVPAIPKGILTVALPAGYAVGNGAIAGYVQARQTLAIRGAGMISL